ncbi:MAG: hypothetical protein RLZZ621_990, partial [Gemmatimonadota bacterium]
MARATRGDRTMRYCRVWRFLPLVALMATGGCFATRGDVRLVQGDVASLRADLLRTQQEQQQAIQQTLRLLQVASDSLTRIGARTVSIQGDVRGEMRGIREQLLQVQALLGQSQATINRLRAELEARNAAPPVAPVTVPAGGAPAKSPAGDSVAASAGPGPSQLFTNGKDLLNRGSTATARALFEELLTKYPQSDFSAGARYWIGESFYKEKNFAAADAAFAAMVQTHPNDELAPNALYKRGLLAMQQGNTAQAKRLLEQVVSRYPRSDAAVLAAETLT